MFSAVFFEESKFAKCVTECEKAIEIAREQLADYIVIAKFVLFFCYTLHQIAIVQVENLFCSFPIHTHK